MAAPAALLSLLSLPLLARGFSFTLASAPTVCQNLTLNWSGGTAPYEITLLPLGYVSPEIRTLVDTNTSSTSWSGQLLFPSGSNFVIVLSDATGYGTGGTSTVQTVGGGDSSCLPTSASTLPFTFYMNPETPSQCGNLDFTWDSSAQGQVTISAVIPGGESFQIPVTSGGTSQQWTCDVPQGTDIAFIVGDSRGRGKGGSSDLMSVGGGSGSCLGGNSPSSTAAPAAGAISTAASASASASASGSSSGASASASPSGSSSIPPGSGGGTVTGSPIATGRGGSGQQGQGSSGNGSTSSSHSNAGAIAGGVVGGVVGLALLGLLAFCLMRRRRRSAAGRGGEKDSEGRADLLDAASPGAGAGAGGAAAGRNSRWYQQEPFIPPTTRPDVQSSRVTPSTAGATEGPISSYNRTNTTTDPSRPSTSPTSATAPPLPRGAAAPTAAGRPDTAGDAALAAAAAAHDPKKRAEQRERERAERRTVNWVQHDDAGALPVPGFEPNGEGEEVTVDVPPSYEALQARRSPPAEA